LRNDARRKRLKLASKNVLILAGGGGHTAYGYALAQRLYGRAILHFLVPEGDKLSFERLSKFGTVDFLQKPREAKTPTSEFIPKLLKAFAEAFKKVPSKFDVVVSTGSNFCIPPCLYAWIKGTPIVNIESSVRFTKASKTALLLQPLSAITALHWEEQKKLLKKGVVVGPLIPKPEIKPWNGGYILVTGGTLGHKRLFDAIAKSNLKNVVLQTGKVNPEPYRRRHPEWKILEHSAKFYELIAGADVVVTHFGCTILKPWYIESQPLLFLIQSGREQRELKMRNLCEKKVNAVLVSRDVNLEKFADWLLKKQKEESFQCLMDGAAKLAADLIMNF
jgi:UDP-N-acetylglucosamine--N-acetylmuramyl-(pentapeptide) pyrophosphoryl-undecaprenol N-acetylglucosamine transferase